MSFTYADVVARNRSAYNERAAANRDTHPKEQWKQDERAAFLDRLRAAEARTLLEVGCGTGQDSLYFQQEGLEVTAADLSPAMVSHARSKGLNASVRDVLALGFPESTFDAVYSLNTLLHVPNADLDAALAAIRTVLTPGGLFFLGVYGGGKEEEGVVPEDVHEPPRFFSFRSDQQLLAYAVRAFEVLDFHIRNDGTDFRFQSLTLVKPA
ncbi:class I SAM-dependent methyltransferase [Actinoplanes sp. Pm04-4]|uniref:Class I SAM-dependent methyltransferase n=1 Tax=Paractinoplanes pyxinae TaxID=2997416 RepID=A0ABT4AU63_9ACTN|nr:class I SAM-dependent methyltransferase [Actinoplanes pyxinae]MCY1137782.1 class I SAM-dependent methyltransferase [Actinoplanes pyxinae]